VKKCFIFLLDTDAMQ